MVRLNVTARRLAATLALLLPMALLNKLYLTLLQLKLHLMLLLPKQLLTLLQKHHLRMSL
jgi:hypothetical protein